MMCYNFRCHYRTYDQGERKMNDEEKLNYLTEAGGVRFIPERSVIKVLSEEMKSAAFSFL